MDRLSFQWGTEQTVEKGDRPVFLSLYCGVQEKFSQKIWVVREKEVCSCEISKENEEYETLVIIFLLLKKVKFHRRV